MSNRIDLSKITKDDIDKMTNEQQISFFTEIIEQYPTSSEAFHYRGKAKKELLDYKGAIEDYNEAIRLGPENVMALTSRGIALGKIGDKQGSRADIAAAANLIKKYQGSN